MRKIFDVATAIEKAYSDGNIPKEDIINCKISFSGLGAIVENINNDALENKKTNQRMLKNDKKSRCVVLRYFRKFCQQFDSEGNRKPNVEDDMADFKEDADDTASEDDSQMDGQKNGEGGSSKKSTDKVTLHTVIKKELNKYMDHIMEELTDSVLDKLKEQEKEILERFQKMIEERIEKEKEKNKKKMDFVLRGIRGSLNLSNNCIMEIVGNIVKEKNHFAMGEIRSTLDESSKHIMGLLQKLFSEKPLTDDEENDLEDGENDETIDPLDVSEDYDIFDEEGETEDDGVEDEEVDLDDEIDAEGDGDGEETTLYGPEDFNETDMILDSPTGDKPIITSETKFSVGQFNISDLNVDSDEKSKNLLSPTNLLAKSNLNSFVKIRKISPEVKTLKTPRDELNTSNMGPMPKMPKLVQEEGEEHKMSDSYLNSFLSFTKQTFPAIKGADENSQNVVDDLNSAATSSSSSYVKIVKVPGRKDSSLVDPLEKGNLTNKVSLPSNVPPYVTIKLQSKKNNEVSNSPVVPLNLNAAGSGSVDTPSKVVPRLNPFIKIVKLPAKVIENSTQVAHFDTIQTELKGPETEPSPGKDSQTEIVPTSSASAQPENPRAFVCRILDCSFQLPINRSQYPADIALKELLKFRLRDEYSKHNKECSICYQSFRVSKHNRFSAYAYCGIKGCAKFKFIGAANGPVTVYRSKEINHNTDEKYTPQVRGVQKVFVKDERPKPVRRSEAFIKIAEEIIDIC